MFSNYMFRSRTYNASLCMHAFQYKCAKNLLVQSINSMFPYKHGSGVNSNEYEGHSSLCSILFEMKVIMHSHGN